ncbi:MAG: polyprenol monophosphomannose synthase [Flavobacteriales bacterium]|nr:polyprenol monophosphomannose synthase [Flavobacteriales bacterium]
MSQKLVIIPTYNECGNIENILHAVMDLDAGFHVLVVDDSSPDGTADLVRKKQIDFPEEIHLLEREEKTGLGTAYIAGFRWALSRDYKYIFEMDADFSHNPKDLLRLHDACEKGADMSVGSRYTKNGKVSNWPILRVLMSYFASMYVRMILWIRVMDATAGFVCYTDDVLREIDLDEIEFVGYAFQIEMKYKAIKKGFKLVEVPITFIDRQVGQSKMSMNIFTEAFLGVIKMKFQ